MSNVFPVSNLSQLKDCGVKFVVYIDKDGNDMSTGINVFKVNNLSELRAAVNRYSLQINEYGVSITN